MDIKDFNSLNEKLLKFAGFTPCVYNDGSNEIAYSSVGHKILWNDPKGVYIGTTDIDLVNDVNAQIKWIYPKFIYEIFITKHYSVPDGEWSVQLYTWDHKPKIESLSESEPLAFALAVEKYIDYLEGKNGR